MPDALPAQTRQKFCNRQAAPERMLLRATLSALRVGRVRVAVLDGIMSIALKHTPGLLAERKAAKRVQRRHPAEGTEQPAPAPGSASVPVSGT